MRKYNLDHQVVMLDAHTPVGPGEPADVPDDQTGLWGDEDPRAGLGAEREFKRLRDSSRAELDEELVALGLDPAGYPNKQSAIEAITNTKADLAVSDATDPPAANPEPEPDTTEPDGSADNEE